MGWFKLALVPTPSANAAAPLPQSVEVTREGSSTILILWLPESATYTALPVGSMVKPWGRLNVAELPAPSAAPAAPVPATEATTVPSARRSRFPDQSVKNSVKSGSSAATATAEGLTIAAAPTPSCDVPPAPPAMVAHADAQASTTRKRLLPVSAMKSLPVASSAMPGKALALALAAVPSA